MDRGVVFLKPVLLCFSWKPEGRGQWDNCLRFGGVGWGDKIDRGRRKERYEGERSWGMDIERGERENETNIYLI